MSYGGLHPTLVVEGDSNTAPQAMYSWITSAVQVASISTTYDLVPNYNQAVGGETAAQMATSAETSSVNALHPDVVVLWAGTNDLSSTTASASKIYNNLVTSWKSYIDNGADYVVAVEVTPRTDAYWGTIPRREQDRLSLDKMIDNLSSDKALAGYVDHIKVVKVPASFNSSIDTYDGLHLSAHGAQSIGTAIGTVLASLKSHVTLNGSPLIDGTAAADALHGSDGNDFFRGGAGNDTIDGGAGVDTAIFNGIASQYAVSRIGATSVQVVDNVVNRDGTDTLFNIERLHFTDKTIALDVDGAAGQAYRLYQAALARVPDQAGLTYHVKLLDGGVSLHDDAASFLGSPEFASRYGANLSDQAFVNALYQNVLGRGPDAQGNAYWISHLADHSMDHATVLAGFSESPENKALVGVRIADGIAMDNLV